jgi:hypothetical protein
LKVYGYQKNIEDLIELQEVSFQSDIKELDKLIKFLQEVKEQHSKINGEVELCHSHFRDWDIEWKAGSTDIIVVTTSK